ncbi:hypothetical protein [Halolamina sp.]|uniref:hypothetical protein n=1 Tax=Halolamina sp. TaxID=1940283 RepID=UPI003562F6D1
MPRNAFLDTGVVLAFCFQMDMHHVNCRNYLTDNDHTYFINDDIEEEYNHKEAELVERYSSGILRHVSEIKRSDYEGQLDSMDMSQIRRNFLDTSNPAYRFLTRYYANELPNFILVSELEEQLRSLAREIEEMALFRKDEFDGLVYHWEQQGDAGDLETELAAIHSADRDVCIAAHDLAAHRTGETELATTNPRDFVDDGHRDMILEHTALDDVVSLAVRS